HIEDCVRFTPIRYSIDWRQLAVHLLTSFKLTRQCGLKGFEDVPGGERHTLHRSGRTRTLLWNPGEFCRSGPIENAAVAACQLRATVQTSVSAWAARHTDIIHCLSGGLDSSIVASCLAQAPSKPNVTCLNLYVAASDRDKPVLPNLSKRYLAKLHRVSSHGDERQFARLVARACGFQLIEQEKRVEHYDLRRIWDSPLATLPTMYVHNIDLDATEGRLVGEKNASAVFNGQIGDTVFFTTFQSLGALDYAYQHRFGRHFIAEVARASALSRESVWLVTGEAVRHGIFRRPKPPIFDYLKSPQLMPSHAIDWITQRDIEHPWVQAAGRLAPGKRAHVEGLASSGLFYYMSFFRERMASSVYPLASQPVIELCLRIPTYVLLFNGISRGLARLAFADVLPKEVRDRTVKGYNFSFYQHVVQANLDYVRESLLDGLLVSEGVLDREKLDQYLQRDAPFLTVTAGQILAYLSAEAWARQWDNIMRQSATADAQNASLGSTSMQPENQHRSSMRVMG
ncbi:MAG TPA: asparagine synthase C-terminal domain-containing protein, partial [Candidatus Sulfotelmatobacter sp.]|nr:asparagine synthase C-terminal domain-containing protein [Candidatus Sulfotelmatobacter sp.]